jgi:hypothetical protein
MLARMLRNWLSRHRNPTNFALHAAGIPATIAGVALAITGHWLLAGGMFVGGYALQFIGHVVEQNRSGEEDLIRRILRRR